MAKVRQPYDETRYAPWLGRAVEAGAVVAVPDDDLASYLEAGWQAADGPTAARHRELHDAGTVTVAPAATVDDETVTEV